MNPWAFVLIALVLAFGVTAYLIGRSVGQRDEARRHLRTINLWREALTEARDRLIIAEGSARYENGNLIIARTLTNLIGDDPW